MRPALRRFAAALAVLAGLGPGAAWADEPPATWAVSPRVEYSDVEVNGNDGRWEAWSLAAERSAGAGSTMRAAIGRQDRNGLTDDELHLGASGRAGDWHANASVQLSPDPVFLPEWGYQVQLDRAAGVNRRAGAGYRRLRFRDSSVHLASAHMTFYRGDDEFGVEYRFGRNAVLDHDIRVVQLRAALLRGRNRFGVYLAQGDYLFDALGVPGGDGAGWSATMAFARSITPSTLVRLEAGSGRESDTFRQQSIALSVHYRP